METPGEEEGVQRPAAAVGVAEEEVSCSCTYFWIFAVNFHHSMANH